MAEQDEKRYLNPDLPVEERVEDLNSGFRWAAGSRMMRRAGRRRRR